MTIEIVAKWGVGVEFVVDFDWHLILRQILIGLWKIEQQAFQTINNNSALMDVMYTRAVFPKQITEFVPGGDWLR